jgi:hypothetical protein
MTIAQRDMFTRRYRRVKAPKPLEAEIHQQVVALLHLCAKDGVLYWHTPNSFHVRGVPTNALALAWKRMERIGALAGVPDLTLVIDGSAHFLELKREGGFLSSPQVLFRDRALKAGAQFRVAHSFDEAQAALNDWGALKGKEAA